MSVEILRKVLSGDLGDICIISIFPTKPRVSVVSKWKSKWKTTIYRPRNVFPDARNLHVFVCSLSITNA